VFPIDRLTDPNLFMPKKKIDRQNLEIRPRFRVCFFLTTAYKLFDMQYNVFGSKHRSNVQENEENC